MPGHRARTAMCAQLATLGYSQRERRGHEDVFMDLENGHQVTVIPYPRWGRRIDILTVLSSFPLSDDRALTFHLDLGSQVRDDAAAVPGRWHANQLATLVDEHVCGYLARAHSVGDVLDMLLEGEIRPMGSGGARAVVQHGYYMAKWWQLGDRLERLREIADLIPGTERAEMRRAPWGRTEIAEVLWYGQPLTPPSHPLPWGLGDQGDPHAESWFRATGAHPREQREGAVESATIPYGVLRGHGSH